MSKAPRAIRLDGQPSGEPLGEVPLRQGDLAILPESEPIDAVEPVVAPAAKRGFSWGTLFVAGPPPMVQSTLRMLITKARVNPAVIRYDSFS